MDNIDKNEKIILKRSALPGVDMSVVDLELVSTVKIRVTILKKVMYKIRRQTFIGTRDQLDDMDVIQLGSLKLKYRVMKLIKLDDYGGYIYRINRIDGEPTIGIDINNASKLGQKINIVNRPTFDDLFNYACSLREEVLKEEEDCYTGEACDTKSPIIPIEPAIPCVEVGYQVRMSNFNNGEQRVRYFDCDGIEQQIIQAQKTGVMYYYFCGIEGQTLVRDFVSLPSDVFIVNLVPCTVTPPCTQYTITLNSSENGVIEYIDCDNNSTQAPYVGQRSNQVIVICGQPYQLEALSNYASEFEYFEVIETGSC